MDPAADEDHHKYFEGLAVSHVLGGLSESDGRVFRSHLIECSHCRARVGELRAIAHDLADVERDERRVRAAKAIETKRREPDSEEVELEEPTSPSRTSRIVLLVGLALVLALTGWTFYLRGVQENQNLYIEIMETTNDLLVEGEAAAITSPNGEFGWPSQVRFDEDHVVVLLDGVADGETFVMYQLDADGDVVNALWSTAGDDLAAHPILMRREDTTTEVVVTRPPQGGASGDVVEGTRVLSAALA